MDETKEHANITEETEEVPQEVGDIRIADEVICIVAGLAAQEVPGVIGMSGGIADGINELLGKQNSSKGVHLKYEGKLVNISLYLIIEYGYCIPEIALEVQEKVKNSVETMTGYEVQFVDVHVEGVARRRVTELEKAEAAEDTMADILRDQIRRAEATEENSFEMQLANLNHRFDLPEEEVDAKHKKFLEED